MGYDLSELKKIKEKLDSNINNRSDDDKARWYNLPYEKGKKVVFRFLPSPTSKGELPGILFQKHKQIPELKDIVCYKMHDLDCPMCNMLDKYRDRLDVSSWDHSLKAAMNVLVLNDKEVDPSLPRILIAPATLLQWVINSYEDSTVGDITDPFTGCSIAISREKDGGKLLKVPARESVPLSKDDAEVQKILSKRYDLSQIWRQPDEKYSDIMAKAVIAVENEILRRLEQKEMMKPVNVNNSSAKDDKEVIKDASVADKPVVKDSAHPECFTKHVEGQDSCNMCAYEFDCIEATKR